MFKLIVAVVIGLSGSLATASAQSGETIKSNTLNTVYIVQATDFNAKRLATFKLASSIRFDPAEVPALDLSNVRK